jgi:hypothetical protein
VHWRIERDEEGCKHCKMRWCWDDLMGGASTYTVEGGWQKD